MKKIINHPLFRPIAFGVLFLLASLATRMGFVLIVPIITSNFRFLNTHLPVILGCWMPVLSLIFLWLKWRANDVARQWKITMIYGVLITALSAILLTDHLLMCAFEYKWVLHATETSPLFPYDVIGLLAIFLGIGIYSIIKCIVNKADLLVEPTSTEVVKTRTKIAVWCFLPFACYFTGAGFSFFTCLDAYDPNWPLMIPAILAFFLMVTALGLYTWYQGASEENKRSRHFKSLVIMLSIMLVLGVWLLVGIIVNPYLFPESLSQYYTLGYAIKIPFGIFFSFAGALGPTVVAIVRYCKRYKVKK